MALGTNRAPSGPYHDLKIENFTAEDTSYALVGPFYINFMIPTNVSIHNAMIKNFNAAAYTFLFVGMYQLNMKNISLVDGNIYSTNFLLSYGLLNVNIDGFYFTNVTYSADLNTPIMNWEHFMSFQMNDLVLKNTTLNGLSQMFHFTTPYAPYTSLSNVRLEDCRIGKTTVFSIGSTFNFFLTNLTMTNVQPIDPSDTTSKIINLETLSSYMSNQISISNVYGFNMSVGILSVSNSAQSKTIDQVLTISNVTFEQ